MFVMTRTITFVCAILFVGTVSAVDIYSDLVPNTSPEILLKSAQDVIDRLLGQNSKLFDLQIDQELSVDEKDTFVLSKSSSDNKVTVVGSSAVGATWGVHYYLKEYCGCQITWEGDQLSLPSTLPDVDVSVTTFDRWRYYQNVVTYGYSYLWYDWQQWEREIDWMALNGINLVLAFTAQEAIWERTYLSLKISEFEFTGPAFLAWNRMGNMRVFGGGLTQSWNDNQIALQHQILDRLRNLGITPVLPAFAGLLPRSFSEIYTTSKVSLISVWNNFEDENCCPNLLDPLDPMFSVISAAFYNEYNKEFGTNHIYNCDTFNENTPDSNDPEYLKSISNAIYQGLIGADPKAVWMLQGWMFHYGFWGDEQVKGYLSGVPIGKLLVLDLQSDLTPQFQRTNSYYGHPFIWCMLHNFGGQLGLFGFLEKINQGVVDGRTYPNTTMVGIGLTPEGINTNYVLYDFTLESSFRENKVNLTEWVGTYQRRRYGIENKLLEQAWIIIKDTVYTYGDSEVTPGNTKNIIVERPSMSLKEEKWYDRTKFFTAFELFVNASNSDTALAKSFLFTYDLVDVARQICQNLFSEYYELLIKSYMDKNLGDLENYSTRMLGILEDLDDILETNEKFLLGNWIEGAKKLSTSLEESLNYEYNARNQITLWGPKGEIVDYAAKQWSGLVTAYYLPRWQIFFGHLKDSLVNNSTLDMNQVTKEIFDNVEDPFTKDVTLYPTETEGGSIDVVTYFYNQIKNDAHYFRRK